MRSALLIALVSAALVAGCGGGSPSQDARDRAVNEAMAAYKQAKVDGTDTSRGPCIASSYRACRTGSPTSPTTRAFPSTTFPPTNASGFGTGRRITSSSWIPRAT
jgi:hypothetical protein